MTSSIFGYIKMWDTKGDIQKAVGYIKLEPRNKVLDRETRKALATLISLRKLLQIFIQNKVHLRDDDY